MMKTRTVGAAIASTVFSIAGCTIAPGDARGIAAPGGSVVSDNQRAGRADAANPSVPGATGTTIVKGDPSTIAGDAVATRIQQISPMTTDGR
jgi:hypothetical protein